MLSELVFFSQITQRHGFSKVISDCWLRDPARRQFKGIVMAPGDTPPGYYNYWQGFPVTPKAGNCSLFLDHLKWNIAKGNLEIYDYLINWMAHVIQQPAHRLGVSIVLRGKQGTGKGIFITQFGALFGPHFIHIQHRKHLVGEFNAHLHLAVVVYADEAFYAGDKTSEGVLKALVTEERLPIEYKGRDVIFVKNHVHLLISSNYAWIVPAGLEERRFFVIDVGERHMQDHEYFGKIVHQMENGGRAALLHFLLKVDLNGINLRKFPQTQGLLENKIYTMTSVEKFWHHLLMRGYLTESDSEWTIWIPTKNLHDEFVKICINLGQSRKSSETELGMGLRKLVPNFRRTTREIGKRTIPIYEFASLLTCRRFFDHVLHYSFPWDQEIKPQD